MTKRKSNEDQDYEIASSGDDEDFVMDDEAADEAHEEEDDDDDDDDEDFDDESPKQKKPKKGPASKKQNKSKPETKAKAPFKVEVTPARSAPPSRATEAHTVSATTAPRPIRDLGFKPRFAQTVGYDESIFKEFQAYIGNWAEYLFYIDENNFRQFVKKDSHHPRQLTHVHRKYPFPNIEMSVISQDQFIEEFGAFNDLNLQLNKGKTTASMQLKPYSVHSLHDTSERRALALNVGGYITSSAWLPHSGTDNQFLYLAVSLINISSKNINDLLIHPEISIFDFRGTRKTVKACIQIWKYDLTTNDMQLSQAIVTNNFGVTSDLSWAPIQVDNGDTLGLLMGSFADGKLHAFTIPANEGDTKYTICEKPSMTYEVKEDVASSRHSAITCYSMIADKRIVVGTIDGTIAEFLLPHQDSDDFINSNIDDAYEEDIAIPSFIEAVSDCAISALSGANPKSDVYFLHIETTGTQAWTIQYNNRCIRSDRGATPSSAPVKTHHQLRLFFSLDGQDSFAYTHIKNPQERPSLIYKTEQISSYGVSEFLGHPLTLIGNAHGEIVIVNLARKLLNSSKTSNKFLTPLRLWKVEKDVTKENGLTLISDYVSSPAEKPLVKVSASYPEESISSISWSEDLSGSSVYAAGCSGGLMIVERLDPKL